MAGSIPSMCGIETVILMRLGRSGSAGPVYRIFAENGSAPTEPATRGGHMSLFLLTATDCKKK